MRSRQNKTLILFLTALFALAFCAQGLAKEGGHALPAFLGIERGTGIRSLDRMIQAVGHSPSDFIGIEWGTDIKSLDRMIPADKKRPYGNYDAIYTRSGDVMRFWNVEVDAIYYLFFGGKFIGYAIERKVNLSPFDRKFIGYTVGRKMNFSPVELGEAINRIYGNGIQLVPRSIVVSLKLFREEWSLPTFRIVYTRYRKDKEVALFYPISRDHAISQ